jgi:hypothetical protein
MDSAAGRRSVAVVGGATGLAILAALSGIGRFHVGGPRAATARAEGGSSSCESCHRGIEKMHAVHPLTCTECHGGDASAPEKERAHVLPRVAVPGDERVLPLQFDLPFLRFRNPMDLRVTVETCGSCHPGEVDNVPLSLHGTTSGHLGDGLYENGVSKEKSPRVAIFPVKDSRWDAATAPPGAVPALQRIGGFKATADKDRISTHFSDVPRKSCMQCHLWSTGRAVRGRLGMDGDYRGAGCAACHVPYADDGISRSADPTVSRVEPGHPLRHSMVRVPTTETCTKCHYGDASIGLTFRGLAQPVPGMPQSPDAAGFAPRRLNGVFYIRDDAVNPPDVHHARGMQCADCHTAGDTMGDGRIYTRMEDAVEIDCRSCHGTPEAHADGKTGRGNTVRGFQKGLDGVWLTSPSDGTRRRVKQARDIVDPTHPDYNRSAALAMTGEHSRLECYACHTAWNPNFFGFHFDRNEGFTQLDLLEGTRTPGRVSTQEKVFATFKQYQLGWNSHGLIAPYMVGFSTMATVHGADGSILLDQEMPVTDAGLSGMTMIHHQPHATTARARDCVECHRSPSTWGYGTVNFRLTRELMYAAGDQGVHTVALDRRTPANSRVIHQQGLPPVRAFALRCDDLQGRAAHGYAVATDGSLYVLDFRSPLFPRTLGRLQNVATDATALLVHGHRLILTDGAGGVRLFDISDPAQPKVGPVLVGSAEGPIPSNFSARNVHLDGPYLWVAGGPAGLLVFDLDAPAGPVLLTRLDVDDPELPDDVQAVSVLFQFSRPNPTTREGPRLPARNLVAVAAGRTGLVLVDGTDPRAPVVLRRIPGTGAVSGVALGTVFELGSEGGSIPSREVDYAFAVTPAGVVLVPVTDPVPVPGTPPVPFTRVAARGTTGIRVLRAFNPPFLQTYLLVANATGVALVEVTRPATPVIVAAIPVPGARIVDAEEFPLDRMLGSRAEPLKDVSHKDARYLNREEIRGVLEVPLRRR